uniref:Odorant receptor n=1 Tax=Adelphocoris lineolatus TaxID=236346 RepID=A0A2I4PH87_ADELI|nr:olfactory receptor 55 [Adelphocoris lineolatus]
MIRNWQDEEEGQSLLARMGCKFLNGHSIYVGSWVLRFPVRLPLFLYVTCAVGISIKMVLNYDNLVLIIDCAHMMIHMVVGIQTTLICTKQKGRIMKLKDQLDKFDDVPGKEASSTRIKEDYELQVMNLYRTFSRCILVTINIYILFPICKLFTEAGRAKLSKVLVWQMWLWVPEETWWGFTIIFLFELVTSLFLLLSVMYAVPYLACLGTITVAHCKVLILRLKSLQKRAEERSGKMSESYEAALNYEIDGCARRLHENLRIANEVADVYKYYLSSFYYGGMFALCMSGLQAVAANENIEESLKFMGVLTGELVAIGLATYVSEGIIEGFADVRASIYDLPWYVYPKLSCKRLHLMSTMSSFRGLRTMFGYELTLLHFGDVLNASYKYYNLLLLSMK